MNKILCVIGAAAISVAGGASAAVVHHATVVIEANLGVADPGGAANRYIEGNALEAADGSFYSLGLGGDLTLGFGRTFSGATEIRVSEVTHSYVNLARYREAVDLFAMFQGNATRIGRLSNVEALGGGVLTYTGAFDSLRFVDVTGEAFPGSPSADGFDIDAVGLVSYPTAVPLPASGATLVGALGLMGMVRRRRRR